MPLSCKRAVRVFAAIAAWLGFNVGIVYLAVLLDSNPYRDALGPLMAVVLVGGNLLIPGFLIYYRHRRRDRWIQEEADRWLAKRSQQHTQSRFGVGKVIRRALWLPSLLALAVLLFEPEAMGIVSRLVVGRTVQLNEYRVRIPLTWFVWFGGENSKLIAFMTGKGIWRMGARNWWHNGYQFSAFDLDARQAFKPEPLSQRETLLSEETMAFGQLVMTCREIGYVPSRSDTYVRCFTSKGELYASISGQRADVNELYEVLKTVTRP